MNMTNIKTYQVSSYTQPVYLQTGSAVRQGQCQECVVQAVSGPLLLLLLLIYHSAVEKSKGIIYKSWGETEC